MSSEEQKLTSVAREPSTANVDLWEKVIRDHDRRVIVSLLARGISMTRARELAHETWAHFFQRHPEGPLSHHVFPGLAIKQATFLALSQHRLTVRRAEDALDESHLHQKLVDPNDDPEARASSRERIARARTALDQCSPNARRVFTLVYEHPERTHREVGLELGLSEQRVKQIVCEVRATLRAAIVGGEQS